MSLFLINQTESDLPRVNQSSLDRLEETGAAWRALKARADEMAEKELPALKSAAVGAGGRGDLEGVAAVTR